MKYCPDCGEERPISEFGKKLKYCKLHTNLRQKQYYRDNPEIVKKHRVVTGKWAKDNREKMAASAKKWYAANKERVFAQKRERYRRDPQYVLTRIARSRLYAALKGKKKVGSAVKDMGCTVDQFRLYLESKFYNGMTWENRNELWVIDHSKPLADFDLTDREQFIKAVHYTNSQPLTIEDHLKKTAAELLERAKRIPID